MNSISYKFKATLLGLLSLMLSYSMPVSSQSTNENILTEWETVSRREVEVGLLLKLDIAMEGASPTIVVFTLKNITQGNLKI